MDEEKSVLNILVTNAEVLYSAIREQSESLELPPEGVPPHITLQFPWKSPKDISEQDIDDLEALFKEFKPFHYSLKIGWFGKDVLILEPAIPDDFIDITKAILQKWPHYPYYSGEYNKIEPHITLAYGDSQKLESIANQVNNLLPIEGYCSEIILSVGVPGNMRIQKVFKL